MSAAKSARKSESNEETTIKMATVATAYSVPVPQGMVDPVMLTPKVPDFRPIIDQVTHDSEKKDSVDFDPTEHIHHTPPEQIIMMKDIGYASTTGVSPVAVSQPFPLFSKSAVAEMRKEIFQPEVMENCKFQSNIAACQIRGYAPKYAPFTYDAWTHPDTLAIISKIAGIDLVPEMDYEIAHINVSVKSDKQTAEELNTIASTKRAFDDDEGIAGCPWEDDMPVVGWHRDSYPFVCVLMLSDCTNMVGGETALKTGKGEIVKVRGPEMGCAVVLQGRYINHQALRALGAQERITAVTSFRPKSAFVADDSVLTTVRPISDLSGLYGGFGTYRLEILEERIRAQLKTLRTMQQAGKDFPIKAFKKFCAESEAFLAHTNKEIVEHVVAGLLEDNGIPEEGTQEIVPPALKHTDEVNSKESLAAEKCAC